MGHPAIRHGVLLAAALVMCGAETAAAAQPITLEPLAASSWASSAQRWPNATPVAIRTPNPAPENLAVDEPMSGSPRGAEDRSTEPHVPAHAEATDADSTTAERSEDPPTTAALAAPLTRPVVVLYGDSLAWEARHVFEQALADEPVEVVTRTFGGTAICDWHDEMAEDAATLRPGLVVIEFVGNNYTPCMQDSAQAPLVGAALLDRYAADAEAAIATFTAVGAQVVLAGAPISRPATASLDLHRAPLNAVYGELGERFDGVRYLDAGSAVLDNGAWADTLPCLPFEPCADASPESGTAANVVRAPDGLHFCPANPDADRGVTGDCPVWSSGAFRFGSELARPVLESIAAPNGVPGDTP